jgi:hypothetical protein
VKVAERKDDVRILVSCIWGRLSKRRRRNIRLCHAAALVLVGWYLMVPPPFDETSPAVPIARWMQWKAFDTAAHCEAVRGEMVGLSRKILFDEPAGPPLHPPPDACDKIVANEFLLSECVASDDSRLKGK